MSCRKLKRKHSVHKNRSRRKISGTNPWKGFVYKQNFLSTNDFKLLQDECSRFNTSLYKHKEDLQNVLRYNMVINSSLIRELITKYTQDIRQLTGNPRLYLATNFPIEYRKYGKGSFMDTHRDTQIYKIPQYECLLTISNTTDSVTNFFTRKTVSIQSTPNSLVILKANGVKHNVDLTTYGHRYFLKFIFTETDDLL